MKEISVHEQNANIAVELNSFVKSLSLYWRIVTDYLSLKNTLTYLLTYLLNSYLLIYESNGVTSTSTAVSFLDNNH